MIAIFSLIPPPDYRINPGDVLRVSTFSKKIKVWDYEDQVDLNGFLSIKIPPSSRVEKVFVKDLSLDSASEVVRARISEFIPKVEMVGLDLVQPSEFYVYIYGNVQKAGFLKVSSLTRLSEVVLSDNTLPFSSLSNVYVNGERISLWEGLKGDLKNDPLLKDGDTIFIPKTDSIVFLRAYFTDGLPRPVEYSHGDGAFEILWKSGYAKEFKNMLYVKVNSRMVNSTFDLKPFDTLEFVSIPNSVIVSGEVRAPSTFEYKPGLKVLDYISMAGGFDDNANRRSIYVKSFKGKDFVKVSMDYEPIPGDVIYVPRNIFNHRDVLYALSFLISSASLVISVLR